MPALAFKRLIVQVLEHIGFDNLQLVEEAILFTDHSYVLDNLTPDTPYFAQIIAYDSAGNASDPVGLTFTTLAAGVLTPRGY